MPIFLNLGTFFSSSIQPQHTVSDKGEKYEDERKGDYFSHNYIEVDSKSNHKLC